MGRSLYARPLAAELPRSVSRCLIYAQCTDNVMAACNHLWLITWLTRTLHMYYKTSLLRVKIANFVDFTAVLQRTDKIWSKRFGS